MAEIKHDAYTLMEELKLDLIAKLKYCFEITKSKSSHLTLKFAARIILKSRFIIETKQDEYIIGYSDTCL